MQEDRRSFRSLPISDETLVFSVLKHFYKVDSLEELVLAQDKHIASLQQIIKTSGVWYDRPIRTVRKGKHETTNISSSY